MARKNNESTPPAEVTPEVTPAPPAPPAPEAAPAPSAEPGNALVAAQPVSINGIAYEAGTVLGSVEGDKLIPAIEGVTAGHLKARLRSQQIVRR